MRDDSEAKLGYSLGELMDEFAEDDARWQSLSRYGDVEYIPEDDEICLWIDGRRVYWIPIDQISTCQQFTDWMLHLTRKSWFSGSMFLDLVRVLRRAIYHSSGMYPEQFYGCSMAAGTPITKSSK